MDRINYFFGSLKNIGLAILVWGLIAFGALELWGCAYVNFIQKDPNSPIETPPIAKAKYEVYVRANNRTLFSNDVKQAGSIVTLNGYYVQDGDRYKYVKLPLMMDETYFGDITFRRRE